MHPKSNEGKPGMDRDRWKERAELLLRWAWFVFEVVKFMS